MLAGAIVGNMLKSIARMNKVERFLEIGSYSGFSAMAVAEGMELKEETSSVVCVDNFSDEPESKEVFQAAIRRSSQVFYINMYIYIMCVCVSMCVCIYVYVCISYIVKACTFSSALNGFVLFTD
jgi:hypothetical protein